MSTEITESAYLELLASCEAAVNAADRSLKIARALAEGCRSRLHPPEDVIEAYLARVERDEAQIKKLAARIEQFKARGATLG